MTEEKLIFRTWNNWCLLKLKEIGKSTLKQWADAMGYNAPEVMKKMAEQMAENGKLNINRTESGRGNTYEIKDNVVFKT